MGESYLQNRAKQKTKQITTKEELNRERPTLLWVRVEFSAELVDRFANERNL